MRSRIKHLFAGFSFAGAVVCPHARLELMGRMCHAVGRPKRSLALVTCGTLDVPIAVSLPRSGARARGAKH